MLLALMQLALPSVRLRTAQLWRLNFCGQRTRVFALLMGSTAKRPRSYDSRLCRKGHCWDGGGFLTSERRPLRECPSSSMATTRTINANMVSSLCFTTLFRRSREGQCFVERAIQEAVSRAGRPCATEYQTIFLG